MNMQGPKPIMRLSKTHEFSVYIIGGLLFLSGLGWLIAHYFLTSVDEEFGEAVSPSAPWWLRLHGAAAMGSLIMFGSLIPSHITWAWTFRRNVRSGLCMIAIVFLLTVTGYGLYYIGDEDMRPWISIVHWIGGIAATALLLLHIWFGKPRFRQMSIYFSNRRKG